MKQRWRELTKGYEAATVLQEGSGGIVGMIFPNSSEEKVLDLKKGDAIPVPNGVVSCWYNNGDSKLVVLLLGETSKALVPGEFTFF
ncbi:hypothetical protein L1049_026725 [Liquidambar formosana]|uniref:Cupin type-1 domain-containing protein n=1 Tax=Liquidambar formosana TaxID=63359 RepID=A0AAP0NFB2_LIQFO